MRAAIAPAFPFRRMPKPSAPRAMSHINEASRKIGDIIGVIDAIASGQARNLNAIMAGYRVDDSTVAEGLRNAPARRSGARR